MWAPGLLILLLLNASMCVNPGNLVQLLFVVSTLSLRLLLTNLAEVHVMRQSATQFLSFTFIHIFFLFIIAECLTDLLIRTDWSQLKKPQVGWMLIAVGSANTSTHLQNLHNCVIAGRPWNRFASQNLKHCRIYHRQYCLCLVLEARLL